MSAWVRSLVAALAALALVPSAGAGASWSHHASMVGPDQSIQSAVDAAAPGDTIVVFGTHRENVAVQTDGLTLRGVGRRSCRPRRPRRTRAAIPPRSTRRSTASA